MILAACIDDCMGLAFNSRRQSRDRAVYAELAAMAHGAAIWTDERSAPLFDGLGCNIQSCGDFSEKAGTGEYCFLEFHSPAQFESRTEKIILYRWNRRYPSDLKFDIDLSCWRLESSVEFAGFSHEKITKEVYIRE